MLRRKISNFGKTFRLLLITSVLMLALSAVALAQSAADGFAPNINGIVNDIAVQSDGKIVVGGLFSSVNGQAHSNLARLNVDGSLDPSFNLGADGTVFALAIQAGKIVVGGSFSALGGQVRNNIGRFNSDGTLDTTFNPGANAQVYALKVQADYQLLVGGNFTMLGGQPHNHIGRVSNAGAPDASFTPTVSTYPSAITVQGDGRILIGGQFTTVNGQALNHIARLNADGSLDASFNPNANGNVLALVVQPDGKILVGGEFTSLGNQTRNRIARVNADGSLDAGFNPNADSYVNAIVQRPDGRIFVGGAFTAVGGTSVNRLAPLNANGTAGSPLLGGANSTVYALAIQSDGKLLAGGQFTTVAGSIGRNRLARFNTDGTVDADFIANTDLPVFALAVQRDGKLLVGGEFTSLGGLPVPYLARLNQNGSFDAAFNGSTNGAVYAMTVLPDGKILIGGKFTTVNGQTHNHIARLNPDGGVDGTFTALADNYVSSIVVQPDGKILICGLFTSVNGQARISVARLNANGSLDTGFNPVPDGAVGAIVLQADGKILLGGSFAMIGNQFRNSIARLNADGSLDSGFNPGTDGGVYTMAVQADGKILVGGVFTMLGGQPRSKLGRLNANGTLDTGFNPGAGQSLLPIVSAFALQADGKILVGGNIDTLAGQAVSNLGRLNANGTLDTSFTSAADNVVQALLLQPDGKIVVSGYFQTLGGQPRQGFGRLANTGAANQYLILVNNNSTLDWGRSGASPEVARVTFESSTDGINYNLIGEGTRSILSTWAFNGLSLPTNQPLYLRARGFYPAGYLGGSGSIVESVLQTYISTPACGFALNPTSQSFPAAGGSGSVQLTAADPSCAWTVQSNAAWITPSVFSGNGSGTIGFVVAANNGLQQRTGTLTVGGQTLTITQPAGACLYSVAPQSLNVVASAGANVVNVTTSAGCAWAATSNAAWLSVTTPSGSGSGGAGFTIAANPNAAPRTGTLTVAGQTVIVTQAADGGKPPICPVLTFSPNALPDAQLNAAYNQTITVTNGTPPFNFLVNTGALPNGMQLAANGQLTGTPTQGGTFSFLVSVIDANGCSGSKGYSLTVNAAGGNAGLQFYPLPRPVRIMDTRAGQGNCDNVSTPINGGASLAVPGRLTCEGLTIPANAQALVGNLTAINKTNQYGYLTVYPDGQSAPLASNMIYAPNDILANNFTVGLGASGSFDIFAERTIDAVIDISGYYAPPAAGALYYHPLSKPVRLLDTRPGQGNCDNVNAPIVAGTSLTASARTTCEGLTIPQAAQAIVGNVTVINGSGQLGYLTLYPNGVPAPLAANLIYFPGQILANAFTVSLDASGEFNVFAERTVDVVVDVAGYYSADPVDANGTGLLFNPLPSPVRLLDTRAGQGNCDSVNAPIAGGASLTKQARMTCEGQLIPPTAQAVLGNVTVINQTGQAGYLTLYPTGQSLPLVSNLIYQPNQILSNAFVVGLSGSGQFNLFAERTLDAVVDISGFFAP